MENTDKTFGLGSLFEDFRAGQRVRSSLARGAFLHRIRGSATDATAPQSAGRRLGLSNFENGALLAVTLGYLLAETLWNVSLMETLSRAGASRAEVEAMVSHGRWLAAFGLVWALLRSSLFSLKNGFDGMLNWLLFVSAIVVAYASVGGLYGKAINGLSPSTSMEVFELAAHRMWALKHDLAPARQAHVADATKDAPAVALWPVFLMDSSVASDARTEYESRRNSMSQDSVAAALARYPEIQAARQKLAGAPNSLAKFDQAYAKYIAGSQKIYALPFDGMKRKGIERFADETCGMLPNAAATKEQFAHEMTKSCLNEYSSGGAAYLAYVANGAAGADPVVYSNSGIVVHFSDVKDLSEVDFARYVRNKASTLIGEQLPTEETVKSNDKAHDVIASVIVPPMSMLLSMLGIIANAGGALALVLGQQKHQGIAAVLALVAAALFIPPGHPAGMSTAWPAFEASHPVLSFVAGKVVTAERALVKAKEQLSWP